jgi:hypothetical protein
MRRLGITAIAICLCAGLDVARPDAQSTTVTYFIADGAGQRGSRPGDRELASWALEAWRRAATVLRFEPAKESDALVRLYWTEQDKGLYGEMQPLIVGGRPGAAVFCTSSVMRLGWRTPRIFATSCTSSDSAGTSSTISPDIALSSVPEATLQRFPVCRTAINAALPRGIRRSAHHAIAGAIAG